MPDYNKVILIGRLTADPELKTTQSGIPVVGFTIAINRRAAQGSEPITDFINCVTWRQSAENLARYGAKGSAILIEGELQTRSYVAQDGSKRTICEVRADLWKFAQSKKTESGNGGQAQVSTSTESGTNTDTGTSTESGINAAAQFEALSDDSDLPF